MNITYPCFGCGSTDHIKANCPKRTPSAKTPPGARLEAAPEEKIKSANCLKCGSKGAHHPTCGTPASSPENIASILAAAGFDRTLADPEIRLRKLAIEQVAESRGERPRPGVLSLAAAASIRAVKSGWQLICDAVTMLSGGAVHVQIPEWPRPDNPCPGEFGPDGVWREHCPTPARKDQAA